MQQEYPGNLQQHLDDLEIKNIKVVSDFVEHEDFKKHPKNLLDPVFRGIEDVGIKANICVGIRLNNDCEEQIIIAICNLYERSHVDNYKLDAIFAARNGAEGIAESIIRLQHRNFYSHFIKLASALSLLSLHSEIFNKSMGIITQYRRSDQFINVFSAIEFMQESEFPMSNNDLFVILRAPTPANFFSSDKISLTDGFSPFIHKTSLDIQALYIEAVSHYCQLQFNQTFRKTELLNDIRLELDTILSALIQIKFDQIDNDFDPSEIYQLKSELAFSLILMRDENLDNLIENLNEDRPFGGHIQISSGVARDSRKSFYEDLNLIAYKRDIEISLDKAGYKKEEWDNILDFVILDYFLNLGRDAPRGIILDELEKSGRQEQIIEPQAKIFRI